MVKVYTEGFFSSEDIKVRRRDFKGTFNLEGNVFSGEIIIDNRQKATLEGFHLNGIVPERLSFIVNPSSGPRLFFDLGYKAEDPRGIPTKCFKGDYWTIRPDTPLDLGAIRNQLGDQRRMGYADLKTRLI